MKKIVVLFAGLLSLLYARSQTLTLDPSFAGKGWTYTAFDKGSNAAIEEVQQVLLQSDGSSIMVLDVNSVVVLARYLPGGTLDKRYGTEGFSQGASLHDGKAAQQSDGKVIVAGSYGDNEDEPGGFVIYRFQPDGLLDSSFGENGRRITSFFENYGEATAVAVQGDGKIVVAGFAYNPGKEVIEFALARYHPDGSLDSSFDGDGKLTTNWGGSARLYALVLQSDGRIVAGGKVRSSDAPNGSCGLARYNTDGSLDKSFGGDGMVATEIGGDDLIYSLALQNDGKIVAAGITSDPDGDNVNFALARYNTDGSLDNTFSEDGMVATDFGGDDFGHALAVQTDGKIVVAGFAYVGNLDLADFALARYNTDGTFDNSFDGDGKVVTALAGRDRAYALAIQEDGKIMAGGSTQNYPLADFALVRYQTDGSLDRSFDGDGMLTGYYPRGQYALNSVAVQSDGKVVVAGKTYTGSANSRFKVSLARYNKDGTLDPTFSDDGVLVTDVPVGGEDAFATFILSDGKIVVAGTLYHDYPQMSDVLLARYNPDGSLDGSFGNGGKVITDFGGDDHPAALALQGDGKIIMAGSTRGLVTSMNFALARYNKDGSLDNSFAGDGKLITDFGEETSYATSLAVQADGKIVAAGRAFQQAPGPDFALARYHTDGSLDASFDGDGKVITDFSGNSDGANAVLIQSDGRIVAGGTAQRSDLPYEDFALARYNSDGSLDKSFSGDGKVVVDFERKYEAAYSLALQPDGKILAVGGALGEDYAAQDFALARLNTDGTLDRTFNGEGRMTVDFSGYPDAAFSSYLHGDRLYVAGFGRALPSTYGLLAVYRMDCAPRDYYRDYDKDGYGDAAQKAVACTAPDGYVPNNTDCNDTRPDLHPGAKENCSNRKDDNCDGQINEGCPGLPFLTINDVAVDESAGAAMLTVRLSKKSDQTVTLRYYMVDRTANSKYGTDVPRDYKAASGMLAIAAGSQTATITVKIYGDNLAEGDEYFDVMIHRPLGASIYDPKGRVTIKDLAPAVTSASANAEPEAKALTVKAFPNPVSRYFTLVVKGGGSSLVTVRVMDALGRLVESKTGLAPTTTLQIGHSYRPGIYYAEVVQGAEKVVVQLVKGQ